MHEELVRQRSHALLREAEEARRVVRQVAVRRARRRAKRALAQLDHALMRLS